MPKPNEELDWAYAECFGTKAGKAVLADMMTRYGRRTSFDENPYRTAFNEGARSVVLKVQLRMDRYGSEESKDLLDDRRSING